MLVTFKRGASDGRVKAANASIKFITMSLSLVLAFRQFDIAVATSRTSVLAWCWTSQKSRKRPADPCPENERYDLHHRFTYFI